MEVVENVTDYKCTISLAFTNDLNVVQIAKIHIAVQCIFSIFITTFGKSSESVQCAISGPCLRMRHRPSLFSIVHCTDSEDLPNIYANYEPAD